MPYFEPSRPMPLSFMPPKGTISVEMMPSLMPTMPYSSASAIRQMRPMSQFRNARYANLSHMAAGRCGGCV
jgi:hypothetical protein